LKPHGNIQQSIGVARWALLSLAHKSPLGARMRFPFWDWRLAADFANSKNSEG
jgi:hypothetical protein